MATRLGAALGAAMLLAAGLTGGPDPAAAQQAAPAGSGPAASDTVVRVRAGVHPDRNRLVFDWPGAVDYSIARRGDTVQITFSRPGQADFSRLQRVRLRNVPTIGQAAVDGRLIVQITIPPGSEIKDFRTGAGGVALDIVDPPRREAAAPTPPVPTPPVPTLAAPTPAVAPAPTQPAAPAPAKAPAAAPVPAAPAPARSERPSAPLPQAQAVAPATRAVPEPPPPSAAPLQPVAAQPLSPGGAETWRGTVTVEAQEPAAAAVYVRAGYLYAVFGRPLDLEGRIKVDALIPGLGGPETVPMRGATAFRMAVPDGLEPTVARDGNTWRIALAQRAATRPEGLPVDAQRDFPLGARLVVGVPDARQVVQMNDPVAGDQLLLVPLPNPGQAVAEPHGFAQLRLLPAAQGIVVQPLEDTVAVRPIRDGVEVTTAGGLMLSPPGDLVGVSPTRLSGRGKEVQSPTGLFDLAKWKRGPSNEFNRLRQEVQRAVVTAPEAERDRARMDLAHFYFAHGYAAESLGLLGLLAGNQPDLETRPEFLALRGAARLLYGDPQSAADDLANPALDGKEEATLWRAAAAATRGDWPAAARDFDRVRAKLDGYPDPFFTKLAALAVDARVRTGDRAGAARMLETLARRTGGEFERKPAGQFRRAQLQQLAGDKDGAAASFRAAADGTDRLYRTRAELALVDIELEQGKLTPADAAARLERLRFAWRGDDLELDILQRLGETYMKANNYAEGFNTIRQAVALFPESPRAAELSRGLSDSFANLFIKDGAAALPPVEALGLYDQFKDLAPEGARGDLVVRMLAERMVEIDLLGRAGDLLQAQVAGKLQGVEKGEVGARLAEIRLQDGKPDGALSALDQSEVPDLSAEMVARRRVLRARALADLKRYGEAVALLKEDSSQSAELMRVDIAWRGAQWIEAAAGLAKVIGPPPPAGTPLSKDKADLVLNQAVALSLAGDAAGLDRLRGQFTAAMEGTPHADTFRVLARPGQSGGLVDLASIQSRVKEVGTFQKFLSGRQGAQAVN
ncbi:tetratricopeptide repeat protein [Skermanella mucosa]|uniref:tetratricopeptide repeat protein n=1 Tax=Skermanella mucosa TaxID=1789672 RepID=UPI00192B1839|nr:tetratricopeptide repeat protein [Skermanella mucosa]UEM20188.1 tetratricopeptide repeat protein [Skermanella mucosa]